MTGGQLTNARGRDRAQAPGHCCRGPRLASEPNSRPPPSLESLDATPPATRCGKTPGDAKLCDLLLRPSKPNPGFLLPFPLNTCGSACLPFSLCPWDTHFESVCILSYVALASVQWPVFHILGSNLSMLHGIKMPLWLPERPCLSAL